MLKRMCTIQNVTTLKEQKQEHEGADNQVFVRRDPAVTYFHWDLLWLVPVITSHRDVEQGGQNVLWLR